MRYQNNREPNEDERLRGEARQRRRIKGFAHFVIFATATLFTPLHAR